MRGRDSPARRRAQPDAIGAPILRLKLVRQRIGAAAVCQTVICVLGSQPVRVIWPLVRRGPACVSVERSAARGTAGVRAVVATSVRRVSNNCRARLQRRLELARRRRQPVLPRRFATVLHLGAGARPGTGGRAPGGCGARGAGRATSGRTAQPPLGEPPGIAAGLPQRPARPGRSHSPGRASALAQQSCQVFCGFLCRAASEVPQILS